MPDTILENQEVLHEGKTYIVTVTVKETAAFATIENVVYEVFVYSPTAWSTTDYDA